MSKAWKLKALLGVVCIAMLRTHPSYAALQTPFVERTWHDVQLKIDHPGMDMARAFPPGTHQSNLTYRMIPPALAHLFGLRRTGMLLLSALAGLLLLYFVLAISAAEGGSPFAAVMICLATACAWPGRTAFHELRGGYYDAFALCLVLAAYASRSPILSGGLLFLGAWTDERALIAASFLALSGRIWPLAGATAAYAVTRIAMALAGAYAVGFTGVGIHVLRDQASMIPLAVWSGLGALWIVAGYAIYRSRDVKLAALLSLAVMACLLVYDSTRSLAYCLPAVLIALRGLRGSDHLNLVAGCAGLAGLLIPAVYVEGNRFWIL